MEAAPRGRVSQGSFPTNAPRLWLGSPEEPNGKPPRLPHPAPPPGRPARPLPCPGHQGPWGSTAHRCPLASTFSLLVPLPVSPSALKGQPPDGRPRPAAPRLCGSPHTLCCPLSMLGWLPTPARLRPLLGHILDRAPRGAGRPGSGVGGPTPAGGRLCPVGQHTRERTAGGVHTRPGLGPAVPCLGTPRFVVRHKCSERAAAPKRRGPGGRRRDAASSVPAPQARGPETDPTLIRPSSPPEPPARWSRVPGPSRLGSRGGRSRGPHCCCFSLPLVPLLTAAGPRGARSPMGVQATPLAERRLRAGLPAGLSRGRGPQMPRRGPGLRHPQTRRGVRGPPGPGSGAGTRGG